MPISPCTAPNANARRAPCYYDQALDEAVRDRRELANDLRQAIDNDELDVHYQVQASVTTRSDHRL